MDTLTPTTRPFHVRAGEGETHWWFGGAAQVKASAEQTAGQLTLMEVLEPGPGAGPLHVHHGEDEGFWVLEGRYRFTVGDETFDAGPGDFVWGPRDVPHTFESLEATGRLLYLFTPGGFERFVRETGEPADRFELPPAGRGEPDPERLGPALERARAELLI